MSKQDKTEDWLGENAIAVRGGQGGYWSTGGNMRIGRRSIIRVAMLHHPKVPSIMMQGNQVQLLFSLFCYLVQQYTLSAAYYHDAISLSNIQYEFLPTCHFNLSGKV